MRLKSAILVQARAGFFTKLVCYLDGAWLFEEPPARFVHRFYPLTRENWFDADSRCRQKSTRDARITGF